MLLSSASGPSGLRGRLSSNVRQAAHRSLAASSNLARSKVRNALRAVMAALICFGYAVTAREERTARRCRGSVASHRQFFWPACGAGTPGSTQLKWRLCHLLPRCAIGARACLTGRSSRPAPARSTGAQPSNMLPPVARWSAQLKR